MRDDLINLFALNGRRAVVTGASRGIGRAIAEALAGAGADVLVHYNRSADQAQSCVDEIEAAGGAAWMAKADLTMPADVQNLFNQVADRP
jgi:NAD(P)-dependent dehydrogenase (short-subunit alcohol dehydrogenase family)